MFRLRTLSTVCRVGVSALKVAIAPKKIENAGKLIPCRRHLSTTDNTEKEKQNADHKIKKLDYDEYDEYEFEEPKTAGQKVRFYTAIAGRLALLAFGAVCIFFTAKELFPGRMNPNSLFSEVFEYLQFKDEILNITGDSAKAFGRDVGRNTEGRRNHIDSYTFKANDGTNRTRIRFNIKGSKGQVRVWTEVSDSNKSGEFVYLVCQDMRTGRVITFQDNRGEEFDTERQTYPNSSTVDSISSMLFGKQ